MRNPPAQLLPFAGLQRPLEASWRSVRGNAGEHWAVAPQENKASLFTNVQHEYSQLVAQRPFDNLSEQCGELERAN